MINRLLLACLFFCTTAISAENSSAIQEIKTNEAPKSSGPYSQGLTVDLRQGRLLFISGQSEDDPKTGKLHNETMTAATKQTLDNIEAILKASGTNWENVVRMDVFLQDIKDWSEMNKAYAERFKNGVYPARVVVQTSFLDEGHLAPGKRKKNKGYRIQIACIAFVPDKKSAEMRRIQ